MPRPRTRSSSTASRIFKSSAPTLSARARRADRRGGWQVYDPELLQQRPTDGGNSQQQTLQSPGPGLELVESSDGMYDDEGNYIGEEPRDESHNEAKEYDNITVAAPSDEYLAAETEAKINRSIEAGRALSKQINAEYVENNDLTAQEIASYLLDCSKKNCHYRIDRLENFSENDLLAFKNSPEYSEMIETYKRTGDRRCPTHAHSTAGSAAGGSSARPGKQLQGFERCGYTCTTEDEDEKTNLESTGFMKSTNTKRVGTDDMDEKVWTLRCTVDCPVHVATKSDGTRTRTKVWTGPNKYGELGSFCSDYHALAAAIQSAEAASDVDTDTDTGADTDMDVHQID
ncbi:hypothetical protein IAU59_007459 [Kwoniella sp. CBS 9459]